MNKAMARVDELTQRYATAAEQVASTSEELSSQAESLQSLIAFFRISAVNPAGPGDLDGTSRNRKQQPAGRTRPLAPVMARQALAHGDDPEFTRF
jgi:hypothetical protein